MVVISIYALVSAVSTTLASILFLWIVIKWNLREREREREVNENLMTV